MAETSAISSILKHKGSDVWTIPHDATVYQAIETLAKHNVGALPVLQEGRLVGVFSERDYSRKLILVGKSSKATPVADVMSRDPVTVPPDATVEACLTLMTNGHFRHLPVLDGGRLVGIISIGDLVNWIISAQHATIEQMRRYIGGEI